MKGLEFGIGLLGFSGLGCILSVLRILHRILTAPWHPVGLAILLTQELFTRLNFGSASAHMTFASYVLTVPLLGTRFLNRTNTHTTPPIYVKYAYDLS
jgi:hypothetical protein